MREGEECHVRDKIVNLMARSKIEVDAINHTIVPKLVQLLECPYSNIDDSLNVPGTLYNGTQCE